MIWRCTTLVMAAFVALPLGGCSRQAEPESLAEALDAATQAYVKQERAGSNGSLGILALTYLEAVNLALSNVTDVASAARARADLEVVATAMNSDPPDGAPAEVEMSRQNRAVNEFTTASRRGPTDPGSGVR